MVSLKSIFNLKSIKSTVHTGSECTRHLYGKLSLSQMNFGIWVTSNHTYRADKRQHKPNRFSKDESAFTKSKQL